MVVHLVHFDRCAQIERENIHLVVGLKMVADRDPLDENKAIWRSRSDRTVTGPISGAHCN